MNEFEIMELEDLEELEGLSEFEDWELEELGELEDLGEFEELRYRAPITRKLKCKGRTVRLYGEVWVDIPFWRSYRRFRRQMELKVGRYTTYRSDKGRRVRRLIARSNLKDIHDKLLTSKHKDGDRVHVFIMFTYVGKKGDRRVCKVTFFTYG
jgi:hypothetical protein